MKTIILLFTFLSTSCLLSPYSQWIQTSGPAGTDIYSMFIDGTNMYAGTGKCVYYSSNFGTSWERRSNGINAIPPYPTCFLKNNGVLFTCVSSGGVYMTTDNGLDWTQTNNGIPDMAAIYALSVFNGVILAGSNYGMFLSTDNGASWFKPTTYPPLVTSFLVSGNNIYAGGVYGVYLSTDNGYNWSHIFTNFYTFMGFTSLGSNLFAISQTQVFISGNGGSNWTMLTSPASPDILNSILGYDNKLFLCSRDSGLFISSDDGASWSRASSGFYSKFPTTLLVNGNELYCGASHRGGIFKSTNSGNTWKAMNGGFANCGINALAVSGNRIFAATNYEGVHYSNDLGATWVMFSSQLPGSGFSCVATQDNYLLAGTKDSLYISSDGGSHFVAARGDSISGIAINGNYIFEGGAEGLFRSTDYGNTWAMVNNATARSFAFSGTNVVAGCKNLIMLSTNNGLTWNPIKTGFFGWIAGIVIIDNNIFAATGQEGVLRSTDFGITWDYVNNGLGSGFLNTIVKNEQNLFVVSNDIYYSTNFGDNWYSCGTGITEHAPQQLAVPPPYMFSGTFDLSVWKRPLSELIGIKDKRLRIPSAFSLSQNFPNPFNPSTIISYDIKRTVDVKLVVYDILGKEVIGLVDRKQSPGTYELKFDGTNLSSGIYFYRLTAGDFTDTKKMVLVK